MNVENIKSTLQESIQQFRDLNPEKHSYAYIGMKTNNSTSFVERAAKNRLGIPLDPKKVLPLAKLVCYEPETRKVAKFFAEDMFNQSDILKDALYAKFVEENSSEVPQELDDLFQVDDNYLAYALSLNTKGTTKEEAIEVGGISTYNSLENLTLKGFIKNSNGKYKSLKSLISPSFNSMKKMATTLSNLYKPSNVGKERNHICVYTSGLTREGIKELQNEHRRHLSKVRDIVERNQGEINTFSVAFMDTFTHEDIDTPKEKLKGTHTMKSIIFALIFSLLPYNNDTHADETNNRSIETYDGSTFTYRDILKVHLSKSPLEISEIKLRNGELILRNDISISDLTIINNAVGKVIDPGTGTGGGGGRIINPDSNTLTIYFKNFINGGGDTGGGFTTNPSHFSSTIRSMTSEDGDVAYKEESEIVHKPEQSDSLILPTFIQDNL